jgi:hypothetical protein
MFTFRFYPATCLNLFCNSKEIFMATHGYAYIPTGRAKGDYRVVGIPFFLMRCENGVHYSGHLAYIFA